MKAIALDKDTGLSQIKIVEISNPSAPLNEGEVKLKFKAGSLNHLDLWVAKGLPIVDYKFPHVLGADCCAEVIEAKAPQFKTGDRVVVYPAEGSGLDYDGNLAPLNLSKGFGVRGESKPGVFQEELILPSKYLFLAPEHLSDSQAAALPLTFLTAWQMVVEKAGLLESDPNKEKPILVHGAGSGVSSAILEILLSFGYTNLAVTSRSQEKLDLWKARGVKDFLNQNDLESKIRDWARPSAIFDHIGVETFEISLRLLQNGGSYITCGATSGYAASLDLRQVFFRQLKILGSTMGSLEAFRDLLDWVRLKKLRPQVSHEFKASEVEEAFKTLSAGKQAGKIVLYL